MEQTSNLPKTRPLAPSATECCGFDARRDGSLCCITSHSRWFRAIALALLIAIGLMVRISHWHGAGGFDPSRYMTYSALLAEGQRLETRDCAAVRLAYEAFLASAMRLFGFRNTVCQATGLVVFAGIAVLLYRLTCKLGGPGPALLAVFLYTFLPIDIQQTPAVMPDQLMTLLVLAAALVYLYAVDERHFGRQTSLCLACGLLLGLAVSAKQPAVLLAPVIFLHLTATTKPSWRWLSVLGTIGLGALLVLGLEMLVFWIWSGDPLYRFHTTSDIYIRPGIASVFSWSSRIKYFKVGTNSWGPFGVHCYVLGLAALFAIGRKNRVLLFPLLWCAVLLAFLCIGTVSLNQFSPVVSRSRYLLPVLVMGCAVAGIELTEMGRRLRLRRWVACVCGLILVGVSLRATVESYAPQAIHRTTDWMVGSDPVKRSRLAVPTLAVQLQALDYRRVVARFPQVDSELLGDEIAASLAGRGLVIADEEHLRRFERHTILPFASLYEEEQILGPVWPPYRRWLGIRDQQVHIGSVWWPKVRLDTERP